MPRILTIDSNRFGRIATLHSFSHFDGFKINLILISTRHIPTKWSVVTQRYSIMDKSVSLAAPSTC